MRDVGQGGRFFFGALSKYERYLILGTLIKLWRIQELLILLSLVLLRIQLGRKWWDVVNVHIAYPLLRFPRIFKLFFGRNVVITEHWSAYHHNFHLPDGSRSKRRIQQIFHHKMPVVAVSNALMNDIVRFAGTDDFPQYIIPNVVDSNIFYSGPFRKPNDGPIFLMAANWASIKRPLLAMEAFVEFVKTHHSACLRVVGYGQQWDAMKAFVNDHQLNEQIILLGAMQKEDIAEEMRKADVFLHASSYETFSVVCAEALCCGLPVVASKVGGIPEFVNESNGILVENTLESWIAALHSSIKGMNSWDRESISRDAVGMFAPDVVGRKLVDVYAQCFVGGQG